MNVTDIKMEGGTCNAVDKLKVPGGGLEGDIGLFSLSGIFLGTASANNNQRKSSHMSKMSTWFSVLTWIDSLCWRLGSVVKADHENGEVQTKETNFLLGGGMPVLPCFSGAPQWVRRFGSQVSEVLGRRAAWL